MTEGSSFEQSLEQLERIVDQLQRHDLPLEQAVALYREGTELAERSERLLSEAELQVKRLTQAVQERFEGYVTEPLDPDDEEQG